MAWKGHAADLADHAELRVLVLIVAILIAGVLVKFNATWLAVAVTVGLCTFLIAKRRRAK